MRLFLPPADLQSRVIAADIAQYATGPLSPSYGSQSFSMHGAPAGGNLKVIRLFKDPHGRLSIHAFLSRPPAPIF
jgi:hypothetical protein